MSQMNALPLNVVLRGDSAELLRQFPDNHFDAVVTDPPSGLSKEPNIVEVLTKWLAGEDYMHKGGGFMGKTWDSFVPGPTLWREVFRVLKPGGHVLCFAGTRTQDLMTVALRIAGFEVRDVIEWLYLSGFPKSMDVGKALDKAVGAEREAVGHRISDGGRTGKNPYQSEDTNLNRDGKLIPITTPATPLAKRWDGWGTALKPAHEPIIVARKPLDRTVAYNVEKYECGALNIDGCRIGIEERVNQPAGNKAGGNSYMMSVHGMPQDAESTTAVGRFPANCVTLDSDEWFSKYFNVSADDENVSPQELSKKASKRDRNEDWRGNHVDTNVHPTVKPVDLMRWLVRLVTPPGGTVLDPFAGSGSTLVAAAREGVNFVGCELTLEYADIADARITGYAESRNQDEKEAA